MGLVQLSTRPGIAEVTLVPGKVNALNEQTVQELGGCFENLTEQSQVNAIILAGQGTKFFSFGFDIPEFLSYSKEAFAKYLEKFTGFYTYLFTYPNPLVAALNGHNIAGGCMLALACDYRRKATGSNVRYATKLIGYLWTSPPRRIRVIKSGQCNGPRQTWSVDLSWFAPGAKIQIRTE